MNDHDFEEDGGIDRAAGPQPQFIVAELVPDSPPRPAPVARRTRRRVWLPLGLFLATCVSTLLAGGLGDALYLGYLLWRLVGPLRGLVEGGMTAAWHCWYYALAYGWQYALPVMTILVCHEAGHFLQARRYRVHASYPFFIPMPISPLGTLGAVIVMEPRMGDRRALFDIGITGPLAGLVPTLVFCVLGLHWSSIVTGKDMFGDPLLFRQIAVWLKGPIPEGKVILTHPMAFAAWVGLLVTSLNLMPIGQLDGGHILYGLLRTKAHKLATLLLLAAAVGVIYQSVQEGLPSPWTLMLILLFVMGPVHPPTANDNVRLGPFRTVVGWLTLAFIPIGFTPTPFLFGQ